MDYGLALKLKNAGFPQQGKGWVYLEVEGQDEPDEVWSEVEYPEIETKSPTLEELIEACRDDFYKLSKHQAGWLAGSTPTTNIVTEYYKTPIEAVANLYLKLHQK